MKSIKLMLLAFAIAGVGATAPANAETRVVRHTTVVHKTVERAPRWNQRRHRVCTVKWRHHQRIRTCRWRNY